MQSAPHIIKDFDNSLKELKEGVLSMAAKTRHNLERSIQALLKRDSELANSAIADDDEVDELEREIDRRGMDILVKYQPVATDLRFVISSMKISTNLERISDHAVNIAKRARKVITTPELPDVTLVEPVYAMADTLLRDAVSSFSDGDSPLGASLHARDKELDQLYKSATTQYGNRIEDTEGRSKEYLHLIFIARSLERIGDLACNIGEDAVYFERAKDLRHKSKGERRVIGQE
ncbi:MAG: phosphate signaling complex protein PhoU [Akkermansiaceae bacterium]